MLSRHGARATHFVVGESAERYPEVVAQMAAAGNAVASHSLTHRSLVRLSPDEIAAEVRGGHAAIGDVAAPLFRPPYGHHDLSVARAVKRAGLECVLWSATLGDWRKHTVAELAASLRKALRPGAIVLMHEALHTAAPEDEPDRAALLAALDEVLGEYKQKMTFITVPELLARGRPVRELVERRGADEFVAVQVRT